MRAPRRLEPESLRSRLRVFYASNPDEALTYSDIALKFGCSMKQAQDAVADLANRMEVARVPAQVVVGPCLRRVRKAA